jgi:spore coat polysaccharide biosynthesis predicted glycosyltransferase SpsG
MSTATDNDTNDTQTAIADALHWAHHYKTLANNCLAHAREIMTESNAMWSAGEHTIAEQLCSAVDSLHALAETHLATAKSFLATVDELSEL